MKTFIKSCFGSTEQEIKDYVDNMMMEHDAYKKKKIDLLTQSEWDSIKYLQESFDNSGQFPTENLFLNNFPELQRDIFDQVAVIPVDDFRVHTANLINRKTNRQVSKQIMNLTKDIEEDGITEDVKDRLTELERLSNKGQNNQPIQIRMNMRDIYQEKLTKPLGMITGIKKIDELIGGMDEGTVTVIAGYTAHFKTVFAVNVSYLNAYSYGYNVAYFSLETPKEIMYAQYLSRHSYDMKFNQCTFISHDKIRKCTLTPTEQDYLFDTIEPDLYADYQDKEGKVHKRGRVIFFDLQDFDTFSFTEITNKLEELDDMLGGNLDAVVVDYVQLCKFLEGGLYMDDNKMINAYVAFFRRMAQKFRSGKKLKKLIIVLLSQINRESWKRASRNEGRYDLTCLADANELERGGNRVFTTYTSENMKIVKEAQVQLLKNRNGATMWEPEKVFADPEAYVYGEEFDSFGQTLGGSISQNNLSDALSTLDVDDLFGS